MGTVAVTISSTQTFKLHQIADPKTQYMLLNHKQTVSVKTIYELSYNINFFFVAPSNIKN